MKPRSLYLVDPPNPAEGHANREGAAGLGALDRRAKAFLYPPHLLATLAASAQAAGWRARLLDAAGMGLDTRATLAQIPDGEVAIVVRVSFISHEADSDFLRLLRLERSCAWILVLGAPTARMAETWYDEGLADAFLLGEPEGAFTAALASREMSTVGILTPARLGANSYDEAGRMTNLDELPYPAWEHVDLPRYGLLSILSSRGCPDGCTYCPYTVAQGATFRVQSPLRTADEVDWLVRTHKPPRLVFRDPVFARDRKRVQTVCRELDVRGVHIPWECESRPEHFDSELLQEMRAVGCDTVKIGLETTDPALLAALHRTATREAAEAYVTSAAEVVRLCRDLGMACRVFAMTGLPGQSDEAAVATGRFLQDLHPDALHVKPFQWYPGLNLDPATTDGEAQAAMLRRAAQPPRPIWQRLWRRLIH